MSVFGQILSPAVVEQWIIDLSDKWFDEYLAEMERQRGLEPNYYPRLKSLVTANDFDGFWPEDNLPCLLVMNSGMAEPPARDGQGEWRTRWLFGIAVIVSTDTRKDTRSAMHDFSMAFTAMILQHRSLEHPEAILGTSWVDGRPSAIPAPEGDTRRLGAGQMMFNIDVKSVVSERGTPPEPDPRPDPYVPAGDRQEISSGHATIDLVQEIQQS
jgi:hypothetical protein